MSSSESSQPHDSDTESAQLAAALDASREHTLEQVRAIGRRTLGLSIVLSAAATAWLVYSSFRIADARRELRETEGKTLRLAKQNVEAQKANLRLEDTNKNLADAKAKLGRQIEEAKTELEDYESTLEKIRATVEKTASAQSKLEVVEEQVSPALAEARSLWREGYRLFNAGDRTAARQNYLKAHELATWYVSPLNSLGRMALEDGQYDGARDWLKKALDVQPNYAPTLHNMALLEKRQGNSAKACQWVSKALQARPGYELSLRLGRSLRCSTAVGHPAETPRDQ